MYAEIRTNWSKLHEIEQAIIENLQIRPIKTWCPACFRMFERIHQKATGG